MKKEFLKDGIVLRKLIQDFQTDQNENTLYRVLMCLKDSTVYIPVGKFEGKGDVITTIDSTSYVFQPFSKDGKEYAALFTSLSQMKGLDSFEKMEVEFQEIFKYIQTKEFAGIVLDAYGNYMIIPSSLFGILKTIVYNK